MQSSETVPQPSTLHKAAAEQPHTADDLKDAMDINEPSKKHACQQYIYTMGSKVKSGATESRVKCDLCCLELLSKNLARHKRTIHTTSSKVISHNRHHLVVGVDASRGVYLVSQTLRGVPHPIHVQKITLPGNSASMCELSTCLDAKKAAARSLRPCII